MIQLALATTAPAGRPRQGLLDPSVTRMRVHPGDLDLYRHVNNGVYLQMMDVARSNFLADLGAFGRAQREAAGTRSWRRRRSSTAAP